MSATVEAIAKIADNVSPINDFQGSIPGTVEEETATTAELTRVASTAPNGSVTPSAAS